MALQRLDKFFTKIIGPGHIFRWVQTNFCCGVNVPCVRGLDGKIFGCHLWHKDWACAWSVLHNLKPNISRPSLPLSQ